MRTDSLIFRNSIFLWIALAAGLVLLIPLIAMQFTSEVSWDPADFIVMGALLLGAGVLFVLVARKLPHKWRLATGFIIVTAFLYVWVELAVGIFTDLGS